MTPVTVPADPRCTVYLKGEPKALGTVQIMIGIMTLLFGIVLTTSSLSPAIISGISLWGSLIYISSGALTVAAANNSCVIKASLVMNVLSTVAAGIALILFTVDIIYGSVVLRWCHYSYSSYSCDFFGLNMWYGIYGVLLVFSLLEFIISICTSIFACKATCTTTPSYAQMTYTVQPLNPQPMTVQPMTVQPMNAQPMTVQAMNAQPMNVPAINAQPMNMQPMTVQAMNAQSMNAQPMTVQPMNAQTMTAQPYNPAFYGSQDPQRSYPPPPYNKV